jgi:hypothetical protein
VDIVAKSAIKGSQHAALGLDLDLCDNQERLAIKKAGGDALVATLALVPAVNLLEDLIKHLHPYESYTSKQRASSKLRKNDPIRRQTMKTQKGSVKDTLSYSSYKLDAGRKRTSLVTMLEVFTEALLKHDGEEGECMRNIFRHTDVDGSGDIDLGEFKQIKQLVVTIPGLSNMSEYEIHHLFNSAIDDQHGYADDAEDEEEEEPSLGEEAFIKLAQGKLNRRLDEDY